MTHGWTWDFLKIYPYIRRLLKVIVMGGMGNVERMGVIGGCRGDEANDGSCVGVGWEGGYGGTGSSPQKIDS